MAEDEITPAPAPVPAPPWYGAPDAETLGYMQARGYDKMTPDKAFFEAAKAHREAEHLVGVPKDQLLRLPAKDDVKGWNDVWGRLGRPETKDKYDFSIFKKEDGTPLLEKEAAETLMDLAYSLNLPNDSAKLLVQKLMQISENEQKQSSAQNSGEHARQLETLKNNWAHNAAANTVVAQNAARALGLDPVALDTKGAPVTIPYAQAQELFRQVGSKIGEDKFVSSGTGNIQNGPMSREQAQYKMSQLRDDALWREKYFKGDAVAVQEFNDITRMLAAE